MRERDRQKKVREHMCEYVCERQVGKETERGVSRCVFRAK